MNDTSNQAYTAVLLKPSQVSWKQWVNVQMPYRWNIRRLRLGFVLDIGCGIGRNLSHLDGKGVGVDHNPHSVEVARARGLEAYTLREFENSKWNVPGRFDCLLLAHVVEHMTEQEATALVRHYAPLLKPRGALVIVTPQECGYASDRTHIQFQDFVSCGRIAEQSGFDVLRQYSFPLPRLAGRVFRYNEFLTIGQMRG